MICQMPSFCQRVNGSEWDLLKDSYTHYCHVKFAQVDRMSACEDTFQLCDTIGIV